MAKPGLGYAHQKARQEALLLLTDGTPCPRCGKGMYHWQALDLDHVIPRALGGIGGPTRLTHRSCNQLAGAKLGNRIARARRKGRPVKRRPSRW